MNWLFSGKKRCRSLSQRGLSYWESDIKNGPPTLRTRHKYPRGQIEEAGSDRHTGVVCANSKAAHWKCNRVDKCRCVGPTCACKFCQWHHVLYETREFRKKTPRHFSKG